jgi:hypothetical protein
MENMATALLHAGQMALHIDHIEWGKRTRQSQGSYIPDALRIEDGNVTLEKLAAAGAMNAYYIEKVLKIRSGIASSSLLSPPSSSVKKNIRPPPELFSAIRNLLAAPGEPGRGKEKKCRVQL